MKEYLPGAALLFPALFIVVSASCGRPQGVCAQLQPESPRADETLCITVSEDYRVDLDDPDSTPVAVERGQVERIAADVLAATGRTVYSTVNSMVALNERQAEDLDRERCDSVVRVVVRGEPVSALYGPGAVPYFTGARVSGSLELLEDGDSRGLVEFGGSVEPAFSVADVPGSYGAGNPADAPFGSVLQARGGYLGALFAFVGDKFGYNFLARVRGFWVEGYGFEGVKLFGPQYLGNDLLAAGLRDLHSPHAIPYLLNYLQREERHDGALAVTAAAAEALGRAGEACAVEPLIDALEKSEKRWFFFGQRNRHEVRSAAIRSLGLLRGARAIEALESAASHEGLDAELRELAQEELAR